jgi:O-methyltransferase
LRDQYLDLLRDTLTFALWDGRDGSVWGDDGLGRRALRSVLARRSLEVTRHVPADCRAEGRDWPRLAHSMIGIRRMDNLRECVEAVLADEVPGDLIETGVWRGGACIFMRGVLAAHGVTDRAVWVADSFAGLPPPNAARYAADIEDRHHTFGALKVSMAEVRENFRRFGLLDDQVRFLRGWFKDTLPSAAIDRLAVLRLDGDMYESTIDVLDALYDRLSDGGFCIVDDYGAVEGCRRAVTDFRIAHGIVEPLVEVDWTGVYWRK